MLILYSQKRGLFLQREWLKWCQIIFALEDIFLFDHGNEYPHPFFSGTSFYPMDDKMWTEQVVTQITATGKDSSASGIAPATTTYNYWLTKTQGSCPVDTATPPDSDCVGYGWIPNSGTDWQSFYHPRVAQRDDH